MLLVASGASATTIVFGSGGSPGFDGVGDLGNSFSAGVGGGITLTITASGCTTGPCIITSSSVGGGGAGFGFGVNNFGGATDGPNAPELGGPPELLTLLFSSAVTLTGYTLEDVDDGSDNGVIFRRTLPTTVVITSIQNLTDGGTPPGSTYNSAAATYASELLSVSGTQFTVSASSGEFIRLRSVSFDVPEPSSLSLLGLGIALLSVSARRERRRIRSGSSPLIQTDRLLLRAFPKRRQLRCQDHESHDQCSGLGKQRHELGVPQGY